jgi:predicted dehydrogenase/threonine dehydrogenase-like Zn-dependent dehydrogenase
MKQILQSFSSGEIWLADVPVPICKKNGVIVQTIVSFVSAGTEKMLVEFGRKNLIGKAFAMPDQVLKILRKINTEGISNTLHKVATKLDTPIPLGYSCAGIVREVGTEVTDIAVGDFVACGGAGYANHAEYNYVPENLVVKIPTGVSFEEAACATIGSIALQGVRQCDVRVGESVCVIGLGLLGILAVQILKASGVYVIGYDLDSDRCERARALGIDVACAEGIEATCAQHTNGYGVDAVLITASTRSNEPVNIAGEISRQKGTVVVTGLVGMDLPRDQYYKKELNFKLSLSYGPGRYDKEYEENGHDYPYGYVRWTERRNIEAMLSLIKQGTVTPGKLVTHRYSINEALDAYDLLIGKKKEAYLGLVLSYPTEDINLEQKRVVKLAEGGVRNAFHGSSNQGVLKIGCIGAGNFAQGVLLPVLKKIKSVDLYSVCTATGMNAGNVAKKFGFRNATTDARALIRDENIDAVIIATRHGDHATFVIEALNANKHIFVEKPLALNAKELDVIEQKYRGLNEAGKAPLLMVGFNRRFSPHANRVKKYFADRKTPMMITYRINAGYLPPDSWVHDSAEGGGRIVGEVCHFVDLISNLIDSPVIRIHAAECRTDRSDMVAQDNIVITLSYADGSVGTIQYIAVGAQTFPKERCEIFADNSTVVIDNFSHTFGMGERGKISMRGKQNKGIGAEINSFINALINKGPMPIPFDELLATTRVTFAIGESLRKRTSIELT